MRWVRFWLMRSCSWVKAFSKCACHLCSKTKVLISVSLSVGYLSNTKVSNSALSFLIFALAPFMVMVHAKYSSKFQNHFEHRTQPLVQPLCYIHPQRGL